MGTKNNPGQFDCYDKADPDEPIFVLRAKDPYAPVLVRMWAHHADLHGEDLAKVREAYACSLAMDEWRDMETVRNGGVL